MNRSADKSDHKDSRNRPLPYIQEEPLLEPDVCPVSAALESYASPISLRSIQARIHSQERTTKQPSHKPLPQPPERVTTPDPSPNNDTLNILSHVVVLKVQLERLSEERDSFKRDSTEGLIWRQKYQDILKRYKQGEASFYKLVQRNKQLQNELKYSSHSSSEALVESKQIEIKNLQSQLRTVREVTQSNIDVLESSNKRLEGERNQLRQLLDLSNLEKMRLEKEHNLERSRTGSHQDELNRLGEELLYTKQQLKRAEEENFRFQRDNASLREKIDHTERLYHQNINTEVAQHKQNADSYLKECQRLSDEISRLNEKASQDFNSERTRMETENQLRGEIRVLKQQVDSYELERKEHNSLKSDLETAVLRNHHVESQLSSLQSQNQNQRETIQTLEGQLLRLRQTAISHEAILSTYQTLKRQVDSAKIDNQLHATQLSSKVKLLQRQIQHFDLQKTSSDSLIEKLRAENKELTKQISNHKDMDLLKKHLEMSVEEMNRVHSAAKNVISQLTGRLNWLLKEKGEFLKKQQYQEYELEKLYEVLKTRKEELETCYKTIEGLRKGASEVSLGQDLADLLRNRREQLL